jgi:hypothetical protein
MVPLRRPFGASAAFIAPRMNVHPLMSTYSLHLP